jgi:hypothetical protein
MHDHIKLPPRRGLCMNSLELWHGMSKHCTVPHEVELPSETCLQVTDVWMMSHHPRAARPITFHVPATDSVTGTNSTTWDQHHSTASTLTSCGGQVRCAFPCFRGASKWKKCTFGAQRQAGSTDQGIN